MRFYAGKFGSAPAWTVIIVLLAVAFVVAKLLGFLGFAVLGLIVVVVCLRGESDEQNPPIWARTDFDATRKAEQIYGRNSEAAGSLAASDPGGREFKSALRFLLWCGMALAAVGIVGFTWQIWR
jgi:hypothetical protein